MACYSTHLIAYSMQACYHKWIPAFIADPVVTSLQRDRSADHFTLICTSTTSPATSVVWTKDGTTLSFDGSPYQHSQVVTNRRSSTYNNILTSVGAYSSNQGNYTCIVSNRFGTSSRSIVIRGQLLWIQLWNASICCWAWQCANAVESSMQTS